MATIVLTAVGSALGGNIGGAIGAIVGQQIDRALFAPKSRSEGPRLKELDVQTSSYGTQIPAIFGTMRAAGTVIWASDLIEQRTKSGGGKGKPSTVQYSYSVNMAVALSSRPILRIGRIWAEGNLLRGEAGDFKVETEFRLYPGYPDQAVDPLIASAETIASCPAYRDIAYAVFEGLQLADYGNRIPSLTFEIIERDGYVRLVDIAGAASGGVIAGESQENVSGYALCGENVRRSIAPLLSAMPCLARANGEHLEIIDWSVGGTVEPVAEAAKSGEMALARAGESLRPAAAMPQSVVVRHYEPQRDYQLGSQRAQRSLYGGVEREIDLPASVDAATALRFADLQLLQAQRSRASLSGHFLNSAAPMAPGDWVQHGDAGPWRVTEIEFQRGVRKISASRFLSGELATGTASPGRSAGNPDVAIGETRMVLVDLPPMGATDPGAVTIGIFANGVGAGWRRAALSIQSGEQWIDAGATGMPAKIGQAESALPPHSPWLVDSRNSLTVQMLRPDISLPAGEGSPLDANAPLCWLNGEYIRYGIAEYLGSGRYRIDTLLRGCFGSEVHIAGHGLSDDFVLIEAETARILDSGLPATGSSLTLTATGIGDEIPVLQAIAVEGNAVRPLAPVHLQNIIAADGSLQSKWTRRSRLNSGWQDNVDLPIGEEGESYLVELSKGDSALGNWTVSTSSIDLPADTMAGFALESGDVLQVAVRQIGRLAHSAASTSIAIMP